MCISSKPRSNPKPGSKIILEHLMTVLCILIVVVTFPFSMYFCIQVVKASEIAVVLRFGKVRKVFGAGAYFVIPYMDQVFKINMQTTYFDVLPQLIITKDCVTICVDAVVFCRVEYPVEAVMRIVNYELSTNHLAATTIRKALGKKKLEEILILREAIARSLNETINEETEAFGVVIEKLEMRDLALPLQLQRSMAAEAEAVREARAKEISAQGEKDAAKALREAADELLENPVSFQLRFLHVVNSMASDKTDTLVVPVPVDIFRGC